MTPEIEKVARAIYDAKNEYWLDSKEPYDEFQHMARAAIEAMREPTREMMLAWLTQREYGDSKTLMRAKHNAMIDAALGVKR